MPTQERRRAERVVLSPSLTGTVGGQKVRMLDIGPIGTRVEHEDPLTDGAPLELSFRWDEEEIRIQCDVVRSDEHAHDPRERANIFHTGLQFLTPSPA
ncbi:MAG TPA: PilZ domain-containing protein, partial [Thermoanaerobaculia bacterium]|nr:PilZ domain-containing protein [Thermoanaerobaculia bacterium]